MIMARWLRIGFAVSLALNIILIVGFVLFKESVNTDIYRIGALNAASDATLAKYILQELESGDPNRVRDLKQYLRDNIAVSTTEADEYRQAAK